MKKNLLVALALMAGIVTASAQEYYEVNTAPDVRSQAYRPNEVIVKFKSEGNVAVRQNAKGMFKSAGVSSVDKVLQKYGVQQAEQLMPRTGKLAANAPRRVRAYNGNEVEMKDLSKLYCLRFEKGKKGNGLDNSDNLDNLDNVDIFKIVDELKALPEVEFAEPNYLVYACATPEDWITDPLYSEQWGIPAINLPQLWQQPVISGKRPVIAILDTGVEIAHPDIAANIWTNEAEVNGSTKYDDDNNGYKDDVHGWDFVNQTGYIDDYNGHGTHCAGIAAATGGNGLGIVGANPDALIMPVTVMQSDGTGDIATIIKGIDYAAANGADVISMSFGGYSYSIAEEQALGRAYATAVLVGAAGNDCLPMSGKCHRCGNFGAPMFPAAFTFVLGVQATDNNGDLASFSNYDANGPITSEFGETQLYNYELKAPGTTVISTFSNGSYKKLNGTSMACPLVAGAISRLLQTKEYATKELLFGDLIHAANNGNVDMLATYNITDADRKPNLSLVSWRIEDEKDNDGRFDAGETIKFYPMIRNDWGQAENIQVWMEMGDQESHSVLSFTQAMVSYSKPLSSYAKAEMENPIEFKMADDVVDGRHIRLVLYAQCDGMDTPSAQEITITAENGVEIGGMIDHDMTLEAGVNYILTRALVVSNGVTLTVEPGATISTSGSGISIAADGHIKLSGTKERPIVFEPRQGQNRVSFSIKSSNEKENLIIEYCRFNDFAGLTIWSPSNLLSEINNCIFNRCGYEAYSGELQTSSICNDCNFIDSYIRFDESSYISPYSSNLNAVHCLNGRYFNGAYKLEQHYFVGSNMFNLPKGSDISQYGQTGEIYDLGKTGIYWGSSKESILRPKIHDMERSSTATWKVDVSNVLKQPNFGTHGVIWKVSVDGYDAQDEFDILPPLGVGRHKFEVWYSKKVDETINPTITMGVRAPFTQTAISSDASWRNEIVTFEKFRNGFPVWEELVNTDFNSSLNRDVYGWNAAGKYWNWGIHNPSIDNGDSGFTDGYLRIYGNGSDAFLGKMYKTYYSISNGVYKLKIKAGVERLSDGNSCQYVYANKDRVYLTSAAPTEYEVVTTVIDNKLEVGLMQSEKIATWAGIDDVNLELLEESPNNPEVEVSVYTAYLNITGDMAIDGLNRIYVNGGRDLEYFDIPREDSRFNVEVAAAGSMSAGFFGEAGIGKVTLTWEEQDENVDDILGYNIYRYTGDDESTAVKINQRLLDDTEYVDYDVVPGTTYSYFYKIMRTSLTENSPSRVVAVTPVTASKGDSNGSMTVDVADVVTTINYLTGQNPQPFLFDAADVNEDQTINILDIVGTINIIVNPSSNGIASTGEAIYTIEDGVLWVETPVALGGVQVNWNPAKESQGTVAALAALDGFEQVNTGTLFMAYSMSGKTLAPGRHALLKLGYAAVESIMLSDVRGHNVEAVPGEATAIADVKVSETCVGAPYNGTIPYYIYESGRHSVRIAIYDALGHIMHIWNGTVDSGHHSYTWKSASQGVFFAVLTVDGKHIGAAKMVKE